MTWEKNNNSTKFKNKNIGGGGRTGKWAETLISKKWTLFIPAVTALLCYLNGLHGDFVHDDVYAIKNNPDVFGNSSISSLFANDYWGTSMSNTKSHKSYRPLTVLTFRLNYELTGNDPFYFHLVNCLLHVTVTCLFTYTCSHVLHLTDRGSVYSATLFAVHPIHTEAVTGIVGRADLLAAVFFLLSFIVYIKSLKPQDLQPVCIQSRFLFVLSIVLAAAAMLCKENGITALGVCVLYDIGVVCKREVSRILKAKQINADLLPLFCRLLAVTISVLVMLMFRWWIMGGELPRFQRQDNPASFHSSLLTRWLTYMHIWSYNFWLLLAPVTLCYDWQAGSIPLVESIFDPRNQATLTSGIVFVVFSCFSMGKIKRSNTSHQDDIPFISLVLTLIPFIPASNMFFRVGFVLAERILYIPSLGFCVCVVHGFEKLLLHHKRYQKPLHLLLILIVVSLASKTWCRNRVWESRESIFRSGVETMPQNAKVHYNYANYLKDVEHMDESIEHYRETLRLDDTYSQAYNNLGTILDDSSEAESYFLKTLELVPNHQGAHVNLGNMYLKRGDHEKGLAYLQTALTIDDTNPVALTSLATCYIHVGNLTDAQTILDDVLNLHPDYTEAHVSYGGLLSKLGKHAEAAQHYQKAYQLNMRHSTALVNAANEYNKLGEIQLAESLLKQAISIKKEPSAFEKLAVLYYNSGRTSESIWLFDEMSRTFPNTTQSMLTYAKVLSNTENYERAETILLTVLLKDPEDVDARWTLAHAFSKQRKYLQAIEHLTKAIELSEINRQLDLFQLYVDRGNNYKDTNQYDLALEDYKRALGYNAHDESTLGNIGAIYHLYRNVDKAEYYYREALKLNPDNQLVLDNLVKLLRIRNQSEDDRG